MIDIVVPLYNEEGVLAKSVETMLGFLSQSGFPHPYAVTLANNASSDGSWQICQELERKHPGVVRALDIGTKGKGLAVRTAWEKSHADIVSFMDADLASDLSFFAPLVELVSSGQADLAIGSRLGPRSTVISRKSLRKAASHIYNACTRAIVGTPFDDHQCGFKAMKKASFAAIAPKLQERGFFFDTELIAMALRSGFSVRSLDIVWRD